METPPWGASHVQFRHCLVSGLRCHQIWSQKQTFQVQLRTDQVQCVVWAPTLTINQAFLCTASLPCSAERRKTCIAGLTCASRGGLILFHIALAYLKRFRFLYFTIYSIIVLLFRTVLQLRLSDVKKQLETFFSVCRSSHAL